MEEIIGAFDTLQVSDYSKYNMGSFDEKHKKDVNFKQFTVDLQNAFELGATLL